MYCKVCGQRLQKHLIPSEYDPKTGELVLERNCLWCPACKRIRQERMIRHKETRWLPKLVNKLLGRGKQ